VVSVKGVRAVGGMVGRRENRRKEKEKCWGRERKVEQEKAKQTDIWIVRKRELGENRL
jgi:hypothetical protein